jgi:hypothetical protein
MVHNGYEKRPERSNMAYGLPDPPRDTDTVEYYQGFVDSIAEFVGDKRATGWFMDKDDMLTYYRFKWTEKQLFAADVLYDVAMLGDAG